MAKPVLLTISVKKHIQQFIMKEWAQPDEDFVRIHQNTFMGKSLVLALEKMPYRQNKPKEPNPNHADLKICLPSALKHYTLTKESRKNLSEFFEKYFQQCMTFFVKGQVCATGNELHALNMFLRIYDIDADSYDLDLARKCFRDYKDRVLKLNQVAELTAAA